MKIKNTAMIGIGAVGTVYGVPLCKAYGDAFAVIADDNRAERIRKSGITLNEKTFYPRIISPKNSDFSADLLMVCVKNYSLSDAIKDMQNYVNPHTLILPLLNGVTAHDRLKEAFPDNPVFYGLCIYIDALRDGLSVKNVSPGRIQFGNADNTVPAESAVAVQKYLSAAGIEAEICPDMLRAEWHKWMLNVGCNQVTAATGATYGQLLTPPYFQLFHEAMLEVVALAKACSIDLTEKDAAQLEKVMQTFSPNGKTSLLQDIEAGRKTEVDCFSGTVETLGVKYHVPTPVNHVLGLLLHGKEQLSRR